MSASLTNYHLNHLKAITIYEKLNKYDKVKKSSYDRVDVVVAYVTSDVDMQQ